MRILIIDYLAPAGHVGYNKYQIEAISALGYNCEFVSSEEHIRNCCLESVKLKPLPGWLYPKYKQKYKPILERIFGILRLLYLSLFVISNEYDEILFLSYDIMSLFVFRSKKRVMLCNHNNSSDFKSYLKCVLHKRLPKSYEYIVLADFIKGLFIRNNPSHKTHVVPHGLTKCHFSEKSCMPADSKKYVFCSTTSSCDEKFMYEITHSDKIYNFLKNNNIDIVIKTNLNIEYPPFINIIRGFVEDTKYSSLMKNALAVLAPYSEDNFKDRISAVLMECFASNIPILCSNINSFIEYKKFANYNIIIEDEEGFISSLSELLAIKDENYYKDLDQLDPKPYWNIIL